MIYGNICTNNVECFCAPELKEVNIIFADSAKTFFAPNLKEAEEIWADSAEIIEL